MDNSKSVVTTLAQFNYIAKSNYRYLMLMRDGRNDFIDQLEKLKGQLQNQNPNIYDNAKDNNAYKIAIISYVDKIYDMNEYYYYYGDILKKKLAEVAKSVSQIDAEKIKKELSK